jgi:hypothetical protein
MATIALRLFLAVLACACGATNAGAPSSSLSVSPKECVIWNMRTRQNEPMDEPPDDIDAETLHDLQMRSPYQPGCVYRNARATPQHTEVDVAAQRISGSAGSRLVSQLEACRRNIHCSFEQTIAELSGLPECEDESGEIRRTAANENAVRLCGVLAWEYHCRRDALVCNVKRNAARLCLAHSMGTVHSDASFVSTAQEYQKASGKPFAPEQCTTELAGVFSEPVIALSVYSGGIYVGDELVISGAEDYATDDQTFVIVRNNATLVRSFVLNATISGESGTTAHGRANVEGLGPGELRVVPLRITGSIPDEYDFSITVKHTMGWRADWAPSRLKFGTPITEAAQGGPLLETTVEVGNPNAFPVRAAVGIAFLVGGKLVGVGFGTANLAPSGSGSVHLASIGIPGFEAAEDTILFSEIRQN